MVKPRATAAGGPAVVDPFGNILGIMYNAHYLEVLVEVLSFEDTAQWEAWPGLPPRAARLRLGEDRQEGLEEDLDHRGRRGRRRAVLRLDRHHPQVL